MGLSRTESIGLHREDSRRGRDALFNSLKWVEISKKIGVRHVLTIASFIRFRSRDFNSTTLPVSDCSVHSPCSNEWFMRHGFSFREKLPSTFECKTRYARRAEGEREKTWNANALCVFLWRLVRPWMDAELYSQLTPRASIRMSRKWGISWQNRTYIVKESSCSSHSLAPNVIGVVLLECFRAMLIKWKKLDVWI